LEKKSGFHDSNHASGFLSPRTERLDSIQPITKESATQAQDSPNA
jgi:hypothetical protein